MNSDLQSLLASRADSVEPPAFDPRIVVAGAERRIRRRNRLTAAGAALALAVTAGVTALVLDRGGDEPVPSERPDLTWTPGTLPITYGQEQTLHLGGRVIDTGLDYLSVDVTDDGAALTTLDGGIWFTDGNTVEQIGTTLSGRVRPRSIVWTAARPRDWVVTDNAGSLLAWLEYPDRRPDQPELVVYDSGSRAVLGRTPFEVPARGSATILALADRGVFLAENSHGFPEPDSLRRYDVDSGALEPVDQGDVSAARRGITRALVVGASADDGRLLHWEGDRSSLNSEERLTVSDSQIDELFDPHNGERVEMRVPAVYENSDLWFVQWVDDDRFILVTGNPAPQGDLLVCRIDAGRCDVGVDRSTWATEPILPGAGAVGAELAQIRAMQAILAERRE